MFKQYLFLLNKPEIPISLQLLKVCRGQMRADVSKLHFIGFHFKFTSVNKIQQHILDFPSSVCTKFPMAVVLINSFA